MVLLVSEYVYRGYDLIVISSYYFKFIKHNIKIISGGFFAPPNNLYFFKKVSEYIMYDLNDIILEKYLDGKIDDDHYLELLEADSATTATYAGMAGAAGLTAVWNVANKATHEEMITKYKEIKKSYAEDIKDAKVYIKAKKNNEAKQCIKKARKDIEDCEKIIKSSDDNFIAWLSQFAAGSWNDFWLGMLSGVITALVTADENMGKEIFALTKFMSKVRNIVNIVKYNKDAKGLGNVLNSQRANMLASLNFAKKTLDKIENKIK